MRAAFLGLGLGTVALSVGLSGALALAQPAMDDAAPQNAAGPVGNAAAAAEPSVTPSSGGDTKAAVPAFAYSPQPRWPDDADIEPGSASVCAAIRKECPQIKDPTNISTSLGYDAIYSAQGYLAGLRVTRSSGCAPIDEAEMLSRHHFLTAFHDAGAPDLDSLHVELAPGVDPAGVKLVKSGDISISLGCAS